MGEKLSLPARARETHSMYSTFQSVNCSRISPLVRLPPPSLQRKEFHILIMNPLLLGSLDCAQIMILLVGAFWSNSQDHSNSRFQWDEETYIPVKDVTYCVCFFLGYGERLQMSEIHPPWNMQLYCLVSVCFHFLIGNWHIVWIKPQVPATLIPSTKGIFIRQANCSACSTDKCNTVSKDCP